MPISALMEAVIYRLGIEATRLCVKLKFLPRVNEIGSFFNLSLFGNDDNVKENAPDTLSEKDSTSDHLN